MLAKIILVVLLTANRETRVQYTVRYPTAEACQAEARKINTNSSKKPWYVSSFETAECTFDATQLQSK